MPKGPTIRDGALLLFGAASAFLFSHILYPPYTSTEHASYTFSTQVSVEDSHRQPSSPQQHPPDRVAPVGSHRSHSGVHNTHAKQRVKYSPDVPQTVPPDPEDLLDDPVITNGFAETTVVAHAPGWTFFRDVYMYNGTMFIVSSEPQSYFPDRYFITSTGLAAVNTPENIEARIPTVENMDYITPAQAATMFGEAGTDLQRQVHTVEGLTLLYNDPSQFIGHYYHFAAELLFGTWAFLMGVYSPPISPEGELLPASAASPGHIPIPPIARAIYSHSDADGWRDGPGFNGYFWNALFPSTSTEVQIDWEGRVQSSVALHRRAWHFETLVLADRSAAFKGEICGSQNQRTAAEAFEVGNSSSRLSEKWWEPVRRKVLRFSGVTERMINTPARYEEALKTGSTLDTPPVVISYISRQGGRRSLREDDHERLVVALEDLAIRTGWEVNIVQMQYLSKEEQLAIAARTTIMLGVHGNGLTHLIMMPPTRRSAVIEILFPNGFAYDYGWPTRALGMKHFAIWNDTTMIHPNYPIPGYPEGFQGNEIPVHPPTVIQIIEDRIAGKI